MTSLTLDIDKNDVPSYEQKVKWKLCGLCGSVFQKHIHFSHP